MRTQTPLPTDTVREALVVLRRSKGKVQGLTEQAARELVGQVQLQTGLQGEVASVLSSLRSFRVRASADFLKALADVPAVADVQTYEIRDSAKIEPINRRPVTLPD